MKHFDGRWLVVGGCALALVGCAGRATRPSEPGATRPPAEERKQEAAADAPTPPPATSPLAKVTKGMAMSEVVRILGEPTDRNQYVTGKAFIPWYFGDDVTRIEWHYKGLGRVVFTGGGAWGQRGGNVEWVDYDPQETGFRK
ncbi:MAG: hypothetical protein B6D46_15070 [Polyangiaceae bacterium UTPRO1]|jgi:hypothetical protein|nr:hypothetical protein [Myxococcales bacterium]OQY64777.1 MAG: hypothetical protein B6D46_15070 [Polyangiaceae bacterium UTPRO1]